MMKQEISKHVGEISKRILREVILVNRYDYDSYYGYRTISKSIYTMKDAEGNIFVWNTASIMSVNLDDSGERWYPIRKGDKILITGTIKEHSTYKGEAQTKLSRVKVELIEKAKTKEELQEEKAKEQLASLNGEDFIWTMPYKQYKEHYSDCETVSGSFVSADQYHPAMITVIVREGRLKKSGVRGKRFSGYQMENELGLKTTYRAVCEENALKRVRKDFPEHEWKCVHIFDYRS